jgi:hypothetical protein
MKNDRLNSSQGHLSFRTLLVAKSSDGKLPAPAIGEEQNRNDGNGECKQSAGQTHGGHLH